MPTQPGVSPYIARKNRLNTIASNVATIKANPYDRAGRTRALAENASLMKQDYGNQASDPNALQQRRQNLISRVRAAGGAQNAPGLANRLHNVTSQIRAGRQATATTPSAPAPEAPPTAHTLPATIDPTNSQAHTQVPTGDSGQEQFNALFPGQRMFLPENYQGSPLYQFQANEGQKRLDRMYASRGLTGSGAEIGGNTQFLNELGAREADRQQGVAQQEADRLYNFYQDEANRKERVGNEQFDRSYKLTDLALSQNPLQYAYGAAGSLADLYTKQGATNAAYQKDRYGRVSAGGSPGGSVPYPTFQAPFPSSPDFSNINLQSPVLNQNSNFSWATGLGQAGAALFDAYRNGAFG